MIMVVDITNRLSCCKELLGQFTVYVGDSTTATQNALCGVHTASTANVDKVRVTCQQPTSGRYVFILLPGAGRILHVGDVEVFSESLVVPGGSTAPRPLER